MIENQNTIQSYEDEIDLRELITVLLKGKLLIISITLIIALFAGVFSKFILEPVYETRLNIVISMPETYITRYGEYKLPMTSNGEYIKLIKSNKVITNTIVDMGYDVNSVSVESLQNRITIGTINTTPNVVQNNFSVDVSANNPEESLKLAENLYENYIDFMDVMMKERAISYYYNDFTVKINTLEDSLAVTNELLARNEMLLADIPQTINQKEAAKEIAGTNDIIVLENIINPNYTELEKKIMENKVLINETQSNIDQYSINLAELDAEKAVLDKYHASGKVGKIESSIMEVVDMNIYQPSEPVAPTSKSSPNTLLNVAIGGVLGGMFSVMVVLFKAYWKKEI